ncbi:MAG: protein kinase [Bacteroidaceae bacterium]|nr:protein kinase [Bacteroidaceae bacterium]
MENVSCFKALNSSSDSNSIPLNTRGATCHTFLVYYQGRKCFQKKLKPEYWDNPRYLQALQKEYELGRRLEHTNLVRYYTCDDTSIYMEYVDGLTLTDFVKDNPVYFQSREHVTRFLNELLSAIEYMHTNQVIHLDLKPDNIMVTHIGHSAKIVDLGFSYADAYDSTSGQTDSYSNNKISEQADLYSLSKVLEFIKKNIDKSAISDRLIQQLSTSSDVEQFRCLQVHQKQKIRNISIFSVIFLLMLGVYVYISHRQVDRWAGLIEEAHPGAISPTDAPKGIYIVDWMGNLVVPKDWNSDYRAIAVALITDSTRARIALTDLSELMAWGENTFAKPLIHTNDTTLAHDMPGNAISDYFGAYNTKIFMRTNHPNPSAVLSANAYCFPDGLSGYLPALGECRDLWLNLSEINEALRRCKGDEFSELNSWYWTSTQDYTYYRAWSINFSPNSEELHIFANLRNEESRYADEYGAPNLSVRPFGTLY